MHPGQMSGLVAEVRTAPASSGEGPQAQELKRFRLSDGYVSKLLESLRQGRLFALHALLHAACADSLLVRRALAGFAPERIWGWRYCA